MEREREISAPFDFHRRRGDERRRTTRSTTRLMERGNKKRGVEIRWLEIVQADYTFSFVLKYGGSQRENNVSLITRFGSTRATPAPRCSVPFPPSLLVRSLPLRFARSSIPVWVERVYPSIPTPKLRLHRRNGD